MPSIDNSKDHYHSVENSTPRFIPNNVRNMMDEFEMLEVLENDEAVENYVYGCIHPESELQPYGFTDYHVNLSNSYRIVSEDVVTQVSAIFDESCGLSEEEIEINHEDDGSTLSAITDLGYDPLQQFQEAIMACIFNPLYYSVDPNKIASFISRLVEYYEPYIQNFEEMEEILRIYMTFGQEYHILNGEWFYDIELNTFFKVNR